MKEYTIRVYDDRTEWHLDGVLHREDGPAVEFDDGYRAWYINGQFHREDGPAVECADGTKVWYKNGEVHRDDGPAGLYADGSEQWYLNDEEYTEAEFLAKITTKELTIADIEKLLGYRVKVVK